MDGRGERGCHNDYLPMAKEIINNCYMQAVKPAYKNCPRRNCEMRTLDSQPVLYACAVLTPVTNYLPVTDRATSMCSPSGFPIPSPRTVHGPEQALSKYLSNGSLLLSLLCYFYPRQYEGRSFLKISQDTLASHCRVCSSRPLRMDLMSQYQGEAGHLLHWGRVICFLSKSCPLTLCNHPSNGSFQL